MPSYPRFSTSAVCTCACVGSLKRLVSLRPTGPVLVLGFRTTAAACAVSVRERREMSKGRNAITWTMVGDVINLSWGECWRMRRERRSRDVGLEWRFVKD